MFSHWHRAYCQQPRKYLRSVQLQMCYFCLVYDIHSLHELEASMFVDIVNSVVTSSIVAVSFMRSIIYCMFSYLTIVGHTEKREILVYACNTEEKSKSLYFDVLLGSTAFNDPRELSVVVSDIFFRINLLVRRFRVVKDALLAAYCFVQCLNAALHLTS